VACNYTELVKQNIVKISEEIKKWYRTYYIHTIRVERVVTWGKSFIIQYLNVTKLYGWQ